MKRYLFLLFKLGWEHHSQTSIKHLIFLSKGDENVILNTNSKTLTIGSSNNPTRKYSLPELKTLELILRDDIKIMRKVLEYERKIPSATRK